MQEYIGKQFGDYKIIEEIGAGGMGQVFLAENVHHRKKYALKVLPDDLSRDKGFRSRFFDEARVMSELDHPGIVRVHHIGEIKGVYYLVMDYVEGPEGKPRNLREELAQSPDRRLQEDKARDWIIQIAEALSYAHKQGVIHRDIKPANVLITKDGQIKLTDFGLAKAIGSDFILSQIHMTMKSLGDQRTIVDEQRARQQGADSLDMAQTIEDEKPSRRSSGSTGILGTYDYMSPEQREAGEVDERSDIYSLGVMIYRMLTGRRPVSLKAASSIVRGLNKKWDHVIGKCIEHEPEDRYSSVDVLLGDLRSKAGGIGKKLVAVVVVCLVVAAGVFAFMQNQLHTEVKQQEAARIQQEQLETQAKQKELDKQRRKAEGTYEDAQALLQQFLKPDSDCRKLSVELKPDESDYEKVFDERIAGTAKSYYTQNWKVFEAGDGDFVAPKNEQTELKLWAATTAELQSWEGNADYFPGGYKKIAAYLKRGLTFYRFKFVLPGETIGMAYDGLVFVNGHWRIFPKPYRLIRETEKLNK